MYPGHVHPPTTRPYHLRPDVIEIHRAIGGFITAFSEVVARMRRQMELLISNAEGSTPAAQSAVLPGNPLLAILFDKMTADPIRAAYFAMASSVGDLNDADRSVRNALQGLVQYYIAMRNDIAHADWSVGWEVADSGDVVLPMAHKIRASKDGAEVARLPFTATSLGAEVVHLHYLAGLIGVFGDVCIERQLGGEKRPSDLLVVYRAMDVGKAVRERDGTQTLLWPRTKIDLSS
jgi:hypothetical protein